ncbi:IniB N-terminal domain-containing protein [Microbacterium sp. zg.B48]|uniref:IniB N-terminal domain-containing protein n=1 Tax=unclassified Microbacterium TaxID=2609290 RepID=UPI00214CA911|nr:MULTISPECIES: IniB N-terminal domain-containing protein [unclassified Microbacterium]MCR2764171.1 IniB N-terminal domain-containing protein [Microbacterium sp. zg.B48]MCR2808962.1 IniB N-terminal domain-containing protein [Microbacterium sp. zg.B185]WIM18622.1 IniB N-terminal domain-containing protein [Microbacterium sp. zg-B185]
MSTPVATIADALIEFILSLLRDPSAVEEFDANPTGMLASNGLSDVCADDVRAVAPVVIDRPEVDPRPTPAPPKPYPSDVVNEIKTITNNFVTIDNRATIVDQSVNQNIWTEGGDVTQIFDNEAIVASGDQAVAAGDDALVDNSDTDVAVGDVSIGNETTDVDIDGSFNDDSTETDDSVDMDADESFNDDSTNTDVSVDVEDSFNDYTETAVDTDVDVEFATEETL